MCYVQRRPPRKKEYVGNQLIWIKVVFGDESWRKPRKGDVFRKSLCAWENAMYVLSLAVKV